MPRAARLDGPGVMHHIMIRGIERRKIFLDDKDREDFLLRFPAGSVMFGLLPKQYPFEWPLKAFCFINQGAAKDQ